MQTNSPTSLAMSEAILTTLGQEDLQELAEGIFPELHQIALAPRPEEREIFVSALKGRLASERAAGKTV